MERELVLFLSEGGTLYKAGLEVSFLRNLEGTSGMCFMIASGTARSSSKLT